MYLCVCPFIFLFAAPQVPQAVAACSPFAVLGGARTKTEGQRLADLTLLLLLLEWFTRLRVISGGSAKSQLIELQRPF